MEVARAETERGELVLRRRTTSGTGDVLELRVNGTFVMDSKETSTEQALALVALDQVADPRTVLVGGLGLGYTTRAVLADPRVERVVVVEIEAPLIGWLRDGTVPHGPDFLADERLSVVNLDIALALREAAPEAYDLVLLDVDNGPGQLVHEQNAAVYRSTFLRDVRRALAPGGVVSIWSAEESPSLAEALNEVFGTSEVLRYRVDLQGRAEHYWLHHAGGSG